MTSSATSAATSGSASAATSAAASGSASAATSAATSAPAASGSAASGSTFGALGSDRRIGVPLGDRVGASQSSAIRDLLSQAQRPGMISLAGGLPDPALFPRAQLAAIVANVMESSAPLQYGTTQGELAARLAMAPAFATTRADEILITTGSQQGLDLIARTLIDPGDQVVVGDPDYLGALQVFRSYGAALQPIAVDADGMNTDRLEHELQWGLRPKCCYVVPNFHNPTGASMSADRRTHLGELAARYGFLIIEDDPYRDLYCDDGPQVSDFPTEWTAQLRSTSKTLAPGLRVGAVAAPAWLLEPMIIAKQSSDLHTATLSQAIVSRAVAAPWFPKHLAAVRTTYREKRDVLVQALSAQFGTSIDFAVPDGGMFVWAEFATRGDTASWLHRALDAGVCFVPGQAFAVDRDLSMFARLSYATSTPAELVEGVARLASA